MEDFFKNSLVGQLKKTQFPKLTPDENIGVVLDESEFENSPFKKQEINIQKIQDNENNQPKKFVKKRLNDLDGKILENSIDRLKEETKKETGVSNPLSAGVSLKNIRIDAPCGNVFLGFLYKVFPPVYKIIMVKKALKKLQKLNKTAEELVKKCIPYGESEERYDALAESLSSANIIHAKLGKKI